VGQELPQFSSASAHWAANSHLLATPLSVQGSELHQMKVTVRRTDWHQRSGPCQHRGVRRSTQGRRQSPHPGGCRVNQPKISMTAIVLTAQLRTTCRIIAQCTQYARFRFLRTLRRNSLWANGIRCRTAVLRKVLRIRRSLLHAHDADGDEQNRHHRPRAHIVKHGRLADLQRRYQEGCGESRGEWRDEFRRTDHLTGIRVFPCGVIDLR
jgi:hypothetical protein